MNDEKIKEQLKQYKNEMLMYGKYNLRSLKSVIDNINSLHAKKSQYERMIYHWEFRKGVMDAMKYSFDIQMYLRNAQEEHVMSYKEAVKVARDFLDAIAILAQGRLPRTLFSDNKLREILQEVESIVKESYPDYVLAATHISQYRDMKMVTFAVDQNTHSLIVSFPAFIKNYKQPPLSLYEVE